MPTSKHLQDPVFMAHVAALKAGKTTRKQICADLGILMPELSRRFKSCGLIEELRGTKDRSGAHLFKGDSAAADQYAKALEVHRNSMGASLASVVRRPEFSHLSYSYLARLAKRAESAQNHAK